MNASHGLIHGIVAAALALGLGPVAVAHPMDPLSGDEIVAAANILINARVAQPGPPAPVREPSRCGWPSTTGAA
jgi:hypothetical protein